MKLVTLRSICHSSIEWSKYHKNIVSCKLGDSAGEIANNTEIITVDTKSLTMTVEVSGEVDILKFEMNSINPPSNMSLGVKIKTVRAAIQIPKGSSICQIVSFHSAMRLIPNDLLQVTCSIYGMNHRLAKNYLGCEPDLQKRWNGTYHLYFFAVNISQMMSNECKQREIAELNEAFHDFLASVNLARFTFMHVTGVSIERKISQWSKYHGNIVSCKLEDSAGEVDNNTEIITVNTKSLTVTVEGTNWIYS
ncbi:hypothetical protein FGIG_03929 [Fasciola gigantica]|uniref:Uncharacterized protein n=1 Tax=Fasciola gigantica TaxID=46835 RepID=A0A504YV27_FASGI|nr:hypothetical protein FGIG_03929 [Fasciola gigantica]